MLNGSLGVRPDHRQALLAVLGPCGARRADVDDVVVVLDRLVSTDVCRLHLQRALRRAWLIGSPEQPGAGSEHQPEKELRIVHSTWESLPSECDRQSGRCAQFRTVP